MKKLLLLIVVAVAGFAAWYFHAITPVDGQSADRKKVSIQSGWPTIQIANYLKEEGMIRSPLAFRLYVRSKKFDGKLQAGMYLLQKSLSVAEIVDALRSGKAEELVVTIPEGYTVQDIDSLLSSMELMEEGEIVRCASECDFSTYDFLPKSTDGLAERGGKLEGYLYPDTYYVQSEGFVAKFFLERMLNAFRAKVITEHAAEIEASERSLHQLITMGSLIEEETRTTTERQIVSDILWKRYDNNMGLGVDATVRYILDKPSADITHADLNVNSDYNTRKFRGLPPGPITNAGLPSILAAMTPKSSPYWYYLHDKTGQIHYAKTNEEHNTNRYFHLGRGSEE